MGTKRKIAILPWSSVPNHELTDQMQALIHEEASPSSVSASPSNIDHPDPLRPAFPVQPSLNGKVALWHGNALDLPVDGLVHPTNELFERLSPLTDQLYQRSSPELRRELFTKLVKCPTGSVKVTRSYAHRTQVGAKLIIHVASPKYLAKYGCASERWLFKCYFNTLLAAKKCSLRTLALPSLALHVNGFPPHRATHLAVRVVRRFLEKHGECFDLIVFTVDSLEQYHLYKSALKLFFPRSEEEVERQRLVKLDNADQDGQPCVPGREIRIKKNPIKVLTGKNGKPRASKLSTAASMDQELREDQENLGPVQMRSGSFNNSGGDNSGDDGEVIILKPRPQHPSLAPRLLNRCHSFGQMHETRDRKRIIHRTKGQGGQTQTRPLHGKVSSCAGPLEQQLHLSVGPSTLPFSSSSPSLSSTSEQSQYPHSSKSKEHQLLAEIQRKLRLERLQRQVKLAQREARDPQEVALTKQKLNKTIFISHLASASSGGSSKAELDCQSCSSNGSQSSSGSETFKSSSSSPSSPSSTSNSTNKSILTIMGSHFEPEVVCTAQGLEYVMKLLDRIALTGRPFDIVYFHHGWSSGNGTGSSAMSTDTFLATLLGEYVGWQHSTLLDRIYVVNCSIMERLRFWWKRATVLKCLSHKLSFVNSIDQLLALVPEGGSLMHNHDLRDDQHRTSNDHDNHRIP